MGVSGHIKRRTALVLAILLVLAGAIRLVTDTTISPNAHEYEYFVTSDGRMHTLRHFVATPDVQIPMLNPQHVPLDRVRLEEQSLESNGYLYEWFVEKIWVHWFYTPQGGDHMRVVPFVLGMITLYLVYVLGRMVHSRRAGLYAVFFLGIHGMHITHSMHGRFYTCNEVFCVLATILLLKIAEKPTWQRISAYTLTVFGCVASQLLTILLLVPHALFLIGTASAPQRRRYGKIIALVGILAGLLFAALVWRDTAGYGRFDYGYPLDNAIFVKFLVRLTGSNLFSEPIVNDPYSPAWSLTRISADWYVWTMMVVTWLALVPAIKRQSGTGPLSQQRLRLIWAIRIVTLVIYWVFSVCIKNMIVTRNYSWLLPFFAILTAVGLTMLPRWGRVAFLALTYLATTGLCTCLYFQGRGEEFILQMVRHYRRPGELVVIDRWIKLDQLLKEGDYMVAPSPLLSPLESCQYLLNPENLGVDTEGTRETVINSRQLPWLLRMMSLYRGDFLRGKRVWLIAHDLDALIYDCFAAHPERSRILLYRDFGSESIFYIEFL